MEDGNVKDKEDKRSNKVEIEVPIIFEFAS